MVYSGDGALGYCRAAVELAGHAEAEGKTVMDEDFIQRMPLDELSRFVMDLCHKFGVTDDELQRLDRMSRAEFDQYLREIEAWIRQRDKGAA
jgi:hypothetical protein